MWELGDIQEGYLFDPRLELRNRFLYVELDERSSIIHYMYLSEIDTNTSRNFLSTYYLRRTSHHMSTKGNFTYPKGPLA